MSAKRYTKRAVPGRYPRTARVNELLREVVSEELERLSDGDDRLDLLTVTGIDCDGDLSRATVYFDSLPEDATKALAERRAKIQGAIARQVTLRRTPHLEFRADPAVEAAQKVEQALQRAAAAAEREEAWRVAHGIVEDSGEFSGNTDQRAPSAEPDQPQP